MTKEEVLGLIQEQLKTIDTGLTNLDTAIIGFIGVIVGAVLSAFFANKIANKQMKSNTKMFLKSLQHQEKQLLTEITSGSIKKFKELLMDKLFEFNELSQEYLYLMERFYDRRVRGNENRNIDEDYLKLIELDLKIRSRAFALKPFINDAHYKILSSVMKDFDGVELLNAVNYKGQYTAHINNNQKVTLELEYNTKEINELLNRKVDYNDKIMSVINSYLESELQWVENK